MNEWLDGQMNEQMDKWMDELINNPPTIQCTCTYISFNRAEVLAAEVEDLRGELADYNTVRHSIVQTIISAFTSS